MEDFRETNFKKIQLLLDKCVAHEYGMKTNALALKREYLTEAQMKDYIRQEIFNVTEKPCIPVSKEPCHTQYTF